MIKSLVIVGSDDATAFGALVGLEVDDSHNAALTSHRRVADSPGASGRDATLICGESRL